MKRGLSSDGASRGGTPEAHGATTKYRSAFPLAIVYCIAAVLSLFWVGLVRVLQLNPLGWLFSWIPCLLFLVWQYRVASNLEVFEAEGVTASPLWNLFCWLVPLANVYLPYEALCEIWQASSPSESRVSYVFHRQTSSSVLVSLAHEFLSLGDLGVACASRGTLGTVYCSCSNSFDTASGAERFGCLSDNVSAE